ncbi:MAG TPA: hypothetical protein ENK57_03890 [Polyangiaceae bacterium]|nr:hypothetical protein [Polyangiaceae bacterium]
MTQRDDKGRFPKGVSGNPKGGSKKGRKTRQSLSLRQLRYKGEDMCPDVLELWIRLVRKAKRKDATLDEEKLGAAVGEKLMTFVHGRPGPRIDEVGTPEGWLEWPLHKKLDWAERNLGEAQKLVEYLREVASKEAG